LVVNGQRAAIAIVPVRSDSDDPNRRTKGWLPQYITGELFVDSDGQYWFKAAETIAL
jgi:hypothetical protein